MYANDFTYPTLLNGVFEECLGTGSGNDSCSGGENGVLLRHMQGSYQIVIGYDERRAMETTIVER